ncbi:MipA/OmpV family protein [Kordiimonas aquimaris]|uniref:MipA/OmpV family protein n=1 Tax=Kordiimonas aquimaris TaxID=707591 RepID=UPI0021CDED4C|nr:MipA/OmpV family protein [Kordiimonas aquimaris]
MKVSIFTFAAVITTLTYSNDTSAQGQPSGRPDIKPEWTVSVGGGVLFNPTYVGDDDYQLSLLPNIRVAYGNSFFASVQEGVGYNVINQNGWRVGPLVKFDFGRDEGGNSPFRVIGSETNDLDGFGQIDFTFEAGGFLQYAARNFSSKLELRRGINGHEGFVGEFEVNRTGRNTVFGKTGIFSFGPKLKFANKRYNQAFFGVNAAQATGSGLAQYNAGSGVVSYGVSGSQIILLSRNVSAVAFTGYDRLGHEASESTLIEQRGSANQFSAGLFLSYSF